MTNPNECLNAIAKNPVRAWSILLTITSLIGGGAGVGTVTYITHSHPEVVRPSPYTAIDAERDKYKLLYEIDLLKRRIRDLEDK